MEEKLIPQNIAAEQSVLGALLIDKTAINRVVGKLKKEDANVFSKDKSMAELLKKMWLIY